MGRAQARQIVAHHPDTHVEHLPDRHQLDTPLHGAVERLLASIRRTWP